MTKHSNTLQENSLFEVSRSASFANSSEFSALVPAQHYAVQKRIVVPGWWACGLVPEICANGARSLLNIEIENVFICGAEIAPRLFHLVASVWNELFRIKVAGQGLAREVDIDLERFLRGTSVEISEQIVFLESYFGSLARLHPVSMVVNSARRRTHREKSVTRSPRVSCGVLRSRVVHGRCTQLSLSLVATLDDFLLGRGFVEGTNLHGIGIGYVVSLNPDVLRAFGTGRSTKKIRSYLQVEVAKTLCDRSIAEDCAWSGSFVSATALFSHHKDLLSRTKALYDHGVFGWEEAPPRERISAIRARLQLNGGGSGAVLHLLRLSSQCVAAQHLEKKWMWNAALVEPAINAAPVVVEPVVVAKPIVMEAVVVETVMTEADVVVAPREVTKEPSAQAVKSCGAEIPMMDAETDFLVKMMKFYESLSSDEQRALLREKSRMTPGRFRNYMASRLGIPSRPLH
jgi:hypothetical protein